jgi:hypothetical protein
MSARTRSVSAVIRLVNAPPAFRIDVVSPDPPPALLLRPSAGWAQSSAGPLGGLDLRVVLAAPNHRSTVASLSIGLIGSPFLHWTQFTFKQTRGSRRSGPAEDRAQPAEDRAWIRADVYPEYWRSTRRSDDGGDTRCVSGHCMRDLHVHMYRYRPRGSGIDSF